MFKGIFIRARLSVMLSIINTQREDALFAYLGGYMNEFEENIYKDIKKFNEEQLKH